MFWKWLMGFGFFIVHAYAIGLPLTCLRVAAPVTRMIERDLGINMNYVRQQYRKTIALFLVPELILVVLCIFVFPAGPIISYVSSAAFCIICCIPLSGRTKNNITSYVKSYVTSNQTLSEEEQMTIFAYLNYKYRFIDID